jgi:multiple sugar transport system substrate-binding protein
MRLKLIFLLGLLLAACQGAGGVPSEANFVFRPTAALGEVKAYSPAPITLRFTVWTTNESQLALLKEIANSYTATHPNVLIQFDTIPFDDYTAKIAIQLASGNPPDIGWLTETAATSWIQSGALLDLAPVVKKSPDYNFDDFSKSTLTLWGRGEKLFGIPFSTSPEFLTYNIDLFNQAGVTTPDELQNRYQWTWTAFAEAARAIKEKGPAGSYGFIGFDGEMFTAQPWATLVPVIWAYGGNTWSADGSKCLLNEPVSVQAVQLLHDMTFKDKSIVPPGDATSFISGKVGMTLHQLSRLTALKNVPFHWGIAPLPAGPAGSRPVIGQAAVVVFEKSPYREAAGDFVAYLTTKENESKLAVFFPPARTSVLRTNILQKQHPDIAASQLQNAVVNGILNGSVLPTHPEFSKIDQTMRIEFDRLWVPNANVKEVFNAACQDANYYFK